MKRLIICADGTWNFRDQVDKKTNKRHPTNVTKLARAITPRDLNGTDQIVFYHDGVGTSGPLDRVTGGAFGAGIGANLTELYRFLVYNYEAGDQIYLFGFSRGAFTVRTLAGFMNKFGLFHKGDDYYVPDIYGCYESNSQPGSDAWTKAFHNVRDPRVSPPIRFIGVWNTVGALGAPGFLGQLLNKGKYKFHDVDLNPNIENAYHALALDERRKPFTPNLWQRPANWAGQFEQSWFAGVHSNVGGGYSPDGVANEALHWIVEKAEKLGLAVDSLFLDHYTPCFNSVLNDSMTVTYLALGSYLRPVGNALIHGESVHQSAINRKNLRECNYSPENVNAAMQGQPLAVAKTTRIPRGTLCPSPLSPTA